MSEENGKKNWNSPELIVLVRNKPEEAVLTVCKVIPTGGVPFVDTTNDNTGCILQSTPACTNCDTIGAS